MPHDPPRVQPAGAARRPAPAARRAVAGNRPAAYSGAVEIPQRLKEKLEALPDAPGVYLMRDRTGRVVYVGKAASLRARVRSYFRRSTLRSADPKLRGLVRSVSDLDTVVLRSEAEAVLIEGQFIKEYKPLYNRALRDDKRFLLLRADLREPFPRFSTCRIAREDGRAYFGPYASAASARAALDFVEKRFGLRRCRPRVPGPEDHRHCLYDIIRYCSAPCVGKADAAAYRERVDEACAFLRGERPAVLKELREAMKQAGAELDFERAAALRDTLRLLGEAVRRRVRASLTIPMKEADGRAGVDGLREALGLAARPSVIEAYDISNISGTHAVGSLVCAVEGLPARSRYRHFRIRTVSGSDDPAMMAEVIRRRFARRGEAGWVPPDMVLVDGGLAQLRAARSQLEALGLGGLPLAGLAKRYEELYHGPPGRERVVRLPPDSPPLKMLQRLRDEAHRFALTHHRTLRARRLRESALDEVEGVGARRKQVLLARFGSIDRLRRATAEQIAETPGIGPVLAAQVHAALRGGAREAVRPPRSPARTGNRPPAG